MELHNTGVRDRTCVGQWRRTWQRGIKMRRNVVAGNFQGWRLFSNSECPVAELNPTLDMNKVKQDLGEFPKLSVNDDLKIDWDDKVGEVIFGHDVDILDTFAAFSSVSFFPRGG